MLISRRAERDHIGMPFAKGGVRGWPANALIPKPGHDEPAEPVIRQPSEAGKQ